MQETFADVVIADDETSTLTLRDMRKLSEDDANACRVVLIDALLAAGEFDPLGNPERWGDTKLAVAAAAIESLKTNPDPTKPAPPPTIVGTVALYDAERDDELGELTVDYIVACAEDEHVEPVTTAIPGLSLVLDRIGGPPPSPEPPVVLTVVVRG